jgi:hypothetical protein
MNETTTDESDVVLYLSSHDGVTVQQVSTEESKEE